MQEMMQESLFTYLGKAGTGVMLHRMTLRRVFNVHSTDMKIESTLQLYLQLIHQLRVKTPKMTQPDLGPLPKKITGGCLCGEVRYSITFPEGHNFYESVSLPPWLNLLPCKSPMTFQLSVSATQYTDTHTQTNTNRK